MREAARLRPLPWLTALALATLGSLQACDAAPRVSTRAGSRAPRTTSAPRALSAVWASASPEEAPDGGAPDGGGNDGGPDAGPPDAGPTGSNKLALVTAPRTAQAGRCSAVVIVETQDPLGNAINAGSRTTINLAATPSTGFNFYSDADCDTSITSLTLNASRSRVTFYVQGTTAQSVQITASATNWLPASQTETIIPGTPTVLAFLTTSQTLPAGGCSAAVDFETRDSLGNVSPVTTQTRVGLGASSSAGVSFFTDSGCATAATEVVLDEGSSTGRFYFKGRTGGTFSLSASATDFTTSNQSETILPAVRTGTCTLPSGSSSVTCSISPRSSTGRRRCCSSRPARMTTPLTPRACAARSRRSTPSPAAATAAMGHSDPAIQIQWQTAELASGLTVQHLQATCGGAPITELPIQPISSLQQAFLLVSSEKNGTNQGDDDYYAASIFQADEDDFHVDLEFSVDCVPSWLASIQVVELAGANVTRGLTGSMTGNQLVVSDLPDADLTSTALLFTYRTSGASGPTLSAIESCAESSPRPPPSPSRAARARRAVRTRPSTPSPGSASSSARARRRSMFWCPWMRASRPPPSPSPRWTRHARWSSLPGRCSPARVAGRPPSRMTT